MAAIASCLSETDNMNRFPGLKSAICRDPKKNYAYGLPRPEFFRTNAKFNLRNPLKVVISIRFDMDKKYYFFFS